MIQQGFAVTGPGRQTQTGRCHGQMERCTDRQTGAQTTAQTEGQNEQTDGQVHRQMNRGTDRWSGVRQVHTQMDREHRQMDRCTDRCRHRTQVQGHVCIPNEHCPESCIAIEHEVVTEPAKACSNEPVPKVPNQQLEGAPIIACNLSMQILSTSMSGKAQVNLSQDLSCVSHCRSC